MSMLQSNFGETHVTGELFILVASKFLSSTSSTGQLC